MMILTTRDRDLDILAKLLDDYGDQLRQGEADAFGDMRSRLLEDDRRTLTDKQRQWVLARLDTFLPQYQNLVSSGKVPRGREVPVPEVLRNLPKAPPGRKAQA